MSHTLTFLLALFILAVPAQAVELPCEESLSVVDTEMAETFASTIQESKMCFDPKSYKSNKALLEDYKLLDTMGAFDDESCLKAQRPPELEALITKFIEKNLEFQQLSMVATVDPATNNVSVIYTNSSDARFRENALTTRDKWQIAGGTIGGIVIGAVLSERMYAGQADKRQHWIYGAAISGMTSGVTYFVLEKTSLLDGLNLSRQAKKNLITYSGPIMSLVVGVAKELLYDRKRRDRHTVDGNDAAATALGGGLVTPLVINFVF